MTLNCMNVVIFWYILLRQCIKRSFISQKPGEGDLFGTRSLSCNSKYFLFHNIVNVYGLTMWNLHKLTVPRATAINLSLLMPCEDSRLSEVEPMKRYVNITGGETWTVESSQNPPIFVAPKRPKKTSWTNICTMMTCVYIGLVMVGAIISLERLRL